MSRKRINHDFHVLVGGKTDISRTSFEGVPNTNLDTYDKRTGRFKSRRKFGKDGNAYVDLDTPHGNKPPYDHAHDIDVNKVPKRSKEHRPLTRKERREMNRAKRKRKFWK